MAAFVNKVQDSQRILDQSSTLTNSGAMKIDGCDSEIKLNGITYTSSLNTYSINGLSITAMQATGDGDTNAITVTTATDTQAIYDKIKSFLTQYNSLINEKNIVIKHAQWIGNLTLDSLFTADRYML